SLARSLPAATRLLAISTPSTSAPSFASGKAVVPSPHPRSNTLSPLVIPSVRTRASPLSLMAWAMRVKSPFSQSILFGFIGNTDTFVDRGSVEQRVILRTQGHLSSQPWSSALDLTASFPRGWDVWPQNGREVLALLGRGEAKRRRTTGTSKLEAR